MDVVFGKHWLSQCSDSKGNLNRWIMVSRSHGRISLQAQFVLLYVGRYVRSNLNMPAALPARGGAQRDYEMDAPITVVGATQAKIVGMSAQCYDVEMNSPRKLSIMLFFMSSSDFQVRLCWKVIPLLILCTAHPVSDVSRQLMKSSEVHTVVRNLLAAVVYMWACKCVLDQGF